MDVDCNRNDRVNLVGNQEPTDEFDWQQPSNPATQEDNIQRLKFQGSDQGSIERSQVDFDPDPMTGSKCLIAQNITRND